MLDRCDRCSLIKYFFYFKLDLKAYLKRNLSFNSDKIFKM